jgi:hypothetical protein
MIKAQATMTFSDAVIIGTLLTSLGALFIAWRKSTPEIRGMFSSARNDDADAANAYADAAKKSAEQFSQMQVQFMEERHLRQELEDELLKQRQELNKRIGELESRVASQGELIRRLNAQVVSLGGSPVSESLQ